MLDIRDLSVRFETLDGPVQAVQGVSFDLMPSETLAIVGESGSGKTQAAFALMGLLAKNGAATGQVQLDGREILNLPEAQLNRIRAEEIAMIFQDPMTSLNPYLTVGAQMAEVLVLHKGMSKRQALGKSAEMLDAVRIPEARARLGMYPHEFSGGMRQRVMIAMALLCRPRILIADEPTTALDVTVQAQIMQIFREVQREFGTAILLITHDLGIVAGAADRVMVMYGGRVMEQAGVDALFEHPTHPYTQGLLQAVPRMDVEQAQLRTIAGEPIDLSAPPEGCPFVGRCTHTVPPCRQAMPELATLSDGRKRACHAALETVT